MTRCERLLAAMRSGRWVGHMEMRAAGGTRFGARLLELRRAGLRVELRWRNGGWQYRRAR